MILGPETVTLWGDAYIEDRIGDLKFRISPVSFFQVNPIQTKALYEIALEMAGLTGREIVWDAYCGIGSISLFLAQRAKHVYGVEVVPEAIEDARRNAALNGMENVEFYVGKAEDVIPEWHAQHGARVDVMVVDPPRAGCDRTLLETMAAMAPERIVYVSCDPGTLARDLGILCRELGAYTVERVQGVDMFPETAHVETVCLLSKLKSEHHIKVELKLDDMDITSAEKKTTYEEIKNYVLKHCKLKVSSLYIAQVKRKLGIIERENYNEPKSDGTKHPQCPPEKEKAIIAALKYFGMI